MVLEIEKIKRREREKRIEEGDGEMIEGIYISNEIGEEEKDEE